MKQVSFRLKRGAAAAVVSVGLLAALGAFVGMRSQPVMAITSIRVTAQPVPLDTSDPARVEVGALRYLGGLELRSEARGWGGLSGLRLLPDGQLLAVSDRGTWLQLAITEKDGRLTGVGPATMGPLRDEAGKPVEYPAYDAEALELVPNGQGGSDILIAFESQHRIWRYSGGATQGPADIFTTAPQTLNDWLHPWPVRFPDNGGIEAMASRDGAAVIIAEGTGAGRFRPGADARWIPFQYRGQENFKPTDAVFLPVAGRRLALVLSRRFSLLDGVAATLELADLDTAGSGTVTGRMIAQLVPPVSVDNMEAVAVTPLSNGDLAVYLLSDDNQNALQRTLLLKFVLPASALVR